MSRKLRIFLIALAVFLVVLCAALVFVANLLFDFALNPNASFSMDNLFRSGQVEGIESQPPTSDPEATLLWTEYCTQASAWFKQAGEPATLLSHDGLTLRGHLFTREDSHRYAIVCHGYNGDPASMAGYAMRFYDMGCTVLLPAARAHENSGGDYYGMGWPERKDMLGWIDRIIAADPQAEILLFGVSMGGATVMMTSGEQLPDQVKCIIEDCGYTSVWDEFSVQLDSLFGLPNLPLLHTAGLICRLRAGYGFREASAVEQLKQAEVPMLFIHGEADTFVPYSMLQQVYDACASAEKELLSVPDAPHGAAAWTDPDLYWNTVDTFVAKHID